MVIIKGVELFDSKDILNSSLITPLIDGGSYLILGVSLNEWLNKDNNTRNNGNL